MATSSAAAAAVAAPVRVGWVGTAKIGRKNSWALRLSGAGVPAVVGSRSAATAEAYAASWGFEPGAARGSYDAVVNDASVQAVYIPLPTALRMEWALKAAHAGKAVLADKPCAVSLPELQAVTSALAARGLQFCDGVMFMHHARLAKLGEYLHAGPGGPIGAPRLVHSVFGFNAGADWMGSDIRVDSELEPAGCLGDLTWYDIRFALFTFGWELPSHAAVDVHARSSKGVPTETTTTLYWPDGRRAVAHNGFNVGFTQKVRVTGSSGSLVVDDFVLPRDNAEFTVYENPHLEHEDRDVVMPVTRVSVPTQHGHQESAMWRTFCGHVAAGTRDRFWPRVALLTQAVLDAAFESARTGGGKVAVVQSIGDDY